ncbi:MAG TPA: heparan-alpha-glucosaminide N-acetyltransferase domain-containing protein [Patescibacteria group bacterium]|nr:heparan-alpha-glucosaminide N-acetyltransferase domain-containing protein [Patescibacteria group bacterium]
MKHRYVALDWMRGIAMVLMAVDHASGAFNKDRLFTDSAFFYKAGMRLPAFQFFTRWITHICAPAFLFLAGTALALSLERRARAGESNASIDRYLLTRGAIIALLDTILISRFWGYGSIMLQVLYAIGISLVLMIPLRRLRAAWLLGTSIGFLLLGELLIGVLLSLNNDQPTVIGVLMIHGGLLPHLIVPYPVFPWLAVMILGFVFGKRLLRIRDSGSTRWSAERVLMVSGAASLIVFGIVRGLNSYGNMSLLRDNGSLIQWLHVSKYPPSLSFMTLELGLTGIILALLFRLQGKAHGAVRLWNPILVFGQTAFFFYVLHIVLLELSARGLNLHLEMGLGTTYLATVAVLVFLYPFCLRYRRYKASHPGGWARYI